MFKAFILATCFIPDIVWACFCPTDSYLGGLNRAIGSAEHIVFAKVEEFIDNGAVLSVKREFKGEIGQETITYWGGDPTLPSCRGGISQDLLGEEAIFLLHKVRQRTISQYLPGGNVRVTELEDEEDTVYVELIPCLTSIYHVMRNEEGVLFVEGNLLTKEGTNRLALDELQVWAGDPSIPETLVNLVQAERLVIDPNISCFPRRVAGYLKKGDEMRAFVSFPRYDEQGLRIDTTVNKDLGQNDQELKMDSPSWTSIVRFDDDYVETTDEDKKIIEEWINENGPVLRLSAELTYEDGFQDFIYQAVLATGGENPTPLYRQAITVSRDAFDERLANDPFQSFFYPNGVEVDLPYIIPMIDGYYLEIVLSSQLCTIVPNW